LALVSEFLSGGDAATREAAILALGRSRSPGAFGLLAEYWNGHPSVTGRETVLLAMVMLRLPEATDFLISLVSTGPEPEAFAALSALKMHAYDARLTERIAEVIATRNSRSLHERFERDWGKS
jgi:hypothetical protein